MQNQDIVDAIVCDNYLAIKQAIKKGANLNQIVENELNENEESLLFYAIHRKCSFETIKLLIENGVDINQTDSEGVSLLDEAVVCGNIELIKYLVQEQKMDVNVTYRKSKLTPLMQAACYGYEEIVTFLLEKGADIFAKDSNNMDAIAYTKKLQRKNMQKFLEDYVEKNLS